VLNVTLEEPLPHFNQMNFSKHFSKHLNKDAKMRDEINRITMSRTERGNVSFTEQEKFEAESVMDEDDSSREIDDTEFLQGCVDIAKNNLKKYGNVLKETNVSSPQGCYNDIEGYSKLLTELIKAQEALTKMRTSNKIAGQAVKVAVEMVVSDLFTAMVSVTTEAAELLQQEMKGSKLPDEIKKMIVSKVSAHAKASTEEIVNKVKSTYGIK
jgi:hypothetical protein